MKRASSLSERPFEKEMSATQEVLAYAQTLMSRHDGDTLVGREFALAVVEREPVQDDD